MWRTLKFIVGWGVVICSVIVFPMLLKSQEAQIKIKEEQIKLLKGQVNDYRQRYLETKANLDRIAEYINKKPDLSKDEELDKMMKKTFPVSFPESLNKQHK